MQILRRITSFLSWHRRLLAAVCAALAVIGVVQATRTPPPPGEPVMALAAPVPAGELVTDDHLTVVEVPARLATAHTLRPGEVPERARAAVALEEGQLLGRGLLMEEGVVAEGHALVPVQVPDPDVRRLLRPGATVSLVVAFGEVPETLAEARVAELPEPASGTLGAARESGVVLVEVPAEVAPTVAALGQSGQLSILLGAG